VSGSGRITAVGEGEVEIALPEGGAIVIDTGPVFGNTIRDGSGLLDVNDFANSQDFNAISAGINRRVEERVLPNLREEAAVDKTVRFLGAVEIADSVSKVESLKLVPVAIEIL
jgi:predicted lipoprotein